MMNLLKKPFCSGREAIHRVSRGCKSFPIHFSLKTKSDADILGELCNPKWNTPTMIYLAGGFPNPSTFPFYEISFKINNGRTISVQGEEMIQCLQYGSYQGYEPLVARLKTWMTHHHNVRSWEASNLSVTHGSTDALARVFDLVLDSETLLLAPGPLFGSASFWIERIGCKFKAIEKDHLGLKPSHLREIAENLKDTKTKIVLFVDYFGWDRSSKCDADERVVDIYEVAETYNMFIVEIDPYFSLYLPKSPISLLSLDDGCRVFRCDSFSWLFGPGLRVGWVTGPHPLIEEIVSSIDSSIIHASNISQIFVIKALDCLGENGVRAHAQNVHNQLREERERLLQEAMNHFDEKTEWGIYPDVPFLWFKNNNSLGERKYLIPAHIVENHSTNAVTYGTWFCGASEEQTKKRCRYIGKLINDSHHLSKRC